MQISSLTQKLPQTEFQWKIWDCFSLVNWVRLEYGIDPIDAAHVYAQYPTIESFSHKALLDVVPTIGIQQHGFFHLNILLLQSVSEEYCLGTLILDQNHKKWVALMNDYAHIVPLDRLPISSFSMWQFS